MKNALQKLFVRFKSIGISLAHMMAYYVCNLFAMFTVGALIAFQIVNKEMNSLGMVLTPSEIIEMSTNKIAEHMSIIMLFGALLSIAAMFLIARLVKTDIEKVFTFRKITVKAFGQILLLTGAMYVLVVLVMSVLPIPNDAMNDYDQLMEMIMYDLNFIGVLSKGFVAPITEEVLFRGFIMHEMRKIMPTTAAVVVQGILFGIFHMNFVQAIYACIIGVVLGILYVRTKSFHMPMLLHIMFNSVNLIMAASVM